jgi:hypothetical protein
MDNNSLSSVRATICAICHQPVLLNVAKADEDGNAIHEDCYLIKLGMTKPPIGSRARTSSEALFSKRVGKQTLGN